METNDLIGRLAASATPVRPLAAPFTRLLLWFAASLPYVVLVVLVMSPRSDLASKMTDARFLIEQFAALSTAVVAGVVAFSMTIPGADRRLVFAPLVPLAIWLGSLGQSCIQDWLKLGADGMTFRPDFVCFPAITLVGLVPGIVMVTMLRRGAPLLPHVTVGIAALAVAALGNFGLRLFHPQDASLMVLVWQFGTVAAMSALATCAGRRVLPWRRVTIA